MSLLPMGNNDTTGGLLGGGASRGGLLGGLLPNDPRQQAWNQAAFALLATPGNIAQKIGAAGLTGLNAHQAAQQQQAAQKFREMQMQQMQSQMDEQERERKMQEQVRTAALGSVVQPSAIPATAMDYENSFDTGNAAPQMRPGGFDQKGFINRLYQIDPLKAMSIEQQFAPKPDDYKVVGNSLVRIGRDGNVGAAYVDPKEPSLPSGMRMGPNGPEWIPGYLEGQARVRKAGATSVNVGITQEKEENKAVGKFLGEQYADIQKAGISAQGKLNRAQRMEQLMQGINTGKLAPTAKEIAALGQSLGITIDPNLGATQAFEALSNEMALEARNPSGGAGMPGAMSDKDREFLQNITPSLSKTPEGNRLIIETQKRLAKRDADVARLAREYRQQRGTLDEGFFETLRGYSEQNPLFNDIQQKAPQAPGADIDALVNKYRSR